MDQGGAVPIGECKGDIRGNLHRRDLSTYTSDFPDLFFAHAVTAIYSGPPCRSGKSEVDGSDPPFSLPGSGAAAARNLHLRGTSWEGRSRANDPCGLLL